MNQLASYTICARLDGPGYDIRIVGNNGIRQTMLGFTTHVLARQTQPWHGRCARVVTKETLTQELPTLLRDGVAA